MAALNPPTLTTPVAVPTTVRPLSSRAREKPMVDAGPPAAISAATAIISARPRQGYWWRCLSHSREASATSRQP